MELSALVVEADAEVRAWMVLVLRALGVACVVAVDMKDAEPHVHSELDLIIVPDVTPDSLQARRFFERARGIAPLVQCVVVRDDLGRRRKSEGLFRILVRPLAPEAVADCVTASRDVRLSLTSLTRSLVGRVSMKDAQRVLRHSMSQLALRRTGGSRHAAAALLGVDRRYVQKLERNRPQSGALSSTPKTS